MQPDAAPTDGRRDAFVDVVRAGSLVVVVAYHWAFTVLVWEDDGPHATNPIGTTTGLWLATWLLQVMPLFFFVGGWANLSACHRAAARGEGVWAFTRKRLRGLLIPAFGLIAVWWAVMVAVTSVIEYRWLPRAVQLVLSPLWFAFTYAAVILLFPIWFALHRRFGPLVPLWLACIAALVDVARFAHDVPWVGWVNMLVVWGLAHQLGFSYPQIMGAPRRVAWGVTQLGVALLAALVWSTLYPGSMVGVPGERFSNMAPPTLAIVALITLQIGVLMLVRPVLSVRLRRPAWQRFTSTMTRYAMPLYLVHSSGLAVFLIGMYLVNGREPLADDISTGWWLTRPLALTLPLVTTVPLVIAVDRLSARRPAQPPSTGSEPVTR